MNLPEAFENNIKTELESAFDLFQESLAQPAPVSIRINPAKNNSNGDLSAVPWSKFGFYLQERPLFTVDPTFHAGAYYVQEASSMFLEQAVLQSMDTNKELKVLDLCAAPGGKSTHLLSLLNENSLLVSNEAIRSRATILTENITKWGNANVIITNNDAESFQSLPGFFDLIVVDAPCSGEGLFRKEPEAIKEWSPQNVELCYKRQRRILADIWPSLKENGILIYCTCTYNKLENEENLRWLKQQKEITFLELQVDDHWGIEKVSDENIIGYRFYPHRVKGEGFFLSVIRKSEKEENNISHKKKSKLTFLKNVPQQISDWIKTPEKYSFFQWGELISFLPKNKINEAQLVIDNLSIVSAGIAAATMKHDKAIPEHALAMSHMLNVENINTLALSLEEALEYLRKNTISQEETNPHNHLISDNPRSKKGFALVTYKSLPLGWVNVIPNRINNLYPSIWRIRHH